MIVDLAFSPTSIAFATWTSSERVHVHVLMTNRVHLLMTPTEVGQAARVMLALGRRYVRFINDRYHRTGTLWEGRYKAFLVDSEAYLLSCYRYIELNTVRAAMVANAEDYRWSSFAYNAMGKADPLVRPHVVYVGLGVNAAERNRAYLNLVMQVVDPEELDSIRLYLQRQHALGSSRFRAAV